MKSPGVVWDMNRFWTANGVFFGETTNTQFAKLTGQIETQMSNWFTGSTRLISFVNVSEPFIDFFS